MNWQPICDAKSVKNITCVGAGLIGGGWAAYFLSLGFNVTVWDPGKTAVKNLEEVLNAAWPLLEKRGLAPDASRSRLQWEDNLDTALENADYVQESAPENLALKQSLFSDIDKALDPRVVVGSSTSGLLMSHMATDLENPQRFMTCHPFNPSYLIPFIEIVPGEKTSRQAALWAESFFTLGGKQVALIEKETPGFIGNRLQAAIWRECVHMLNNGEATVEQLDMAVTQGLALRWALVGPFMTFHSAVHDGGMRGFLEKFNGFFDKPWSRMDSPKMDKEKIEQLIRATESMAGEEGTNDIVRRRDNGVSAIMDALENT